jgi:hypothetical protein
MEEAGIDMNIYNIIKESIFYFDRIESRKSFEFNIVLDLILDLTSICITRALAYDRVVRGMSEDKQSTFKNLVIKAKQLIIKACTDIRVSHVLLVYKERQILECSNATTLAYWKQQLLECKREFEPL